MESEYLPSLEAVCPAVKVALRDTEAMVFDNAISNSFDADSVSKSISTASDGIIYMDGVLKGYECQQLCYVSWYEYSMSDVNITNTIAIFFSLLYTHTCRYWINVRT